MPADDVDPSQVFTDWGDINVCYGKMAREISTSPSHIESKLSLLQLVGLLFAMAFFYQVVLIQMSKKLVAERQQPFIFASPFNSLGFGT